MGLSRVATRTFHLDPQDWKNLKGEIAERLALQAVFAELPLGTSVRGASETQRTTRWLLYHISHRRQQRERWYFQNGSLNIVRDMPRNKLLENLREEHRSLKAVDPRTPAAKSTQRRLEKLRNVEVIEKLVEALEEGKRQSDKRFELHEEARDETLRLSLEVASRKIRTLAPADRRLLLWWHKSLRYNLYDSLLRALAGNTRRKILALDLVPPLRRHGNAALLDAYDFLDRQLALAQAGLRIMERARPDYVVYEYDGDLQHIYFFEVKAGAAQLNANQARAALQAKAAPGVTFKLLYLPLPDLLIPREFQCRVYGAILLPIPSTRSSVDDARQPSATRNP